MAKSSMDITSFVGKLLEEDDVDLLREGVRVLAQALMETEVSSTSGLGYWPLKRSNGAASIRSHGQWPGVVEIDVEDRSGCPDGARSDGANVVEPSVVGGGTVHHCPGESVPVF